MKKQILQRGFLGFPLGIAIGYVITIVISAIWAKGYYSPAVPELVKAMGSEINAVIFQTALCGIMGAVFAMASVIWEIDKLSIVGQSGIYFAIASAIMLPIAYLNHWMEHTISGFLSYFGIFAAIFLLVWLIQYMAWKSKIRKINKRIKE